MWDVCPPQQRIMIQQLSAIMAGDGLISRCRCQHTAGHVFLDVTNNQLALDLVDICLDNTLKALRKSLLRFANKCGKFTTQKSPKFGL